MQISISPHILTGVFIGVLITILIQHIVNYISHLDLSLENIVTKLNLQWSAFPPPSLSGSNQHIVKQQPLKDPIVLPVKVNQYFRNNDSNYGSPIPVNTHLNASTPPVRLAKKPSFIRAERQNLLLRLQLLNKRLLEADIVQNTAQYQDILQSIILIQNHLEELTQRMPPSALNEVYSSAIDSDKILPRDLVSQIDTPRKPLRL